MPEPRSTRTISLRMLLISVAFVAGSIGWSVHWSDCKYQAVFHAALADLERQSPGGRTPEERGRIQRNARWHEEMRQKYERDAWLPWPTPTPEHPGP